jgi:hypothetical protein
MGAGERSCGATWWPKGQLPWEQMRRLVARWLPHRACCARGPPRALTQRPEGGAQCVRPARWDLRRGPLATAVSTATSQGGCNVHQIVVAAELNRQSKPEAALELPSCKTRQTANGALLAPRERPPVQGLHLRAEAVLGVDRPVYEAA